MGDSTLQNGDLDQILLSCLYALSDGGGNFASLAQAVTDDTLAVTYHNDCGESERAATLGYFDNTIDSNESIL